MSRVGKKPIPLPAGLKIAIADTVMKVDGPKGKLEVPIPAGVKIEKVEGNLEIRRDGDKFAALHGLTRALANNAVVGCSTGFTRELDIIGIGYRADLKGNILVFSLGYSHTIEFLLPKGVDAKIDKQTHLVMTSFDKQLLGQVCADIRSLRPPEPYKQKGIRYTGEVVRKKVGKTGAGGK